jgi:hypothetical protein
MLPVIGTCWMHGVYTTFVDPNDVVYDILQRIFTRRTIRLRSRFHAFTPCSQVSVLYIQHA